MEDSPFQDTRGLDTALMAVYFRMGQYTEDDDISQDLIGFDCPFEDSPTLYADNPEELELKIKAVHAGTLFIGDFEDCYPDVISDTLGKIQVELQRRICCDEKFDPNTRNYSVGRETLADLWAREKWRWVNT